MVLLLPRVVLWLRALANRRASKASLESARGMECESDAARAVAQAWSRKPQVNSAGPTMGVVPSRLRSSGIRGGDWKGRRTRCARTPAILSARATGCGAVCAPRCAADTRCGPEGVRMSHCAVHTHARAHTPEHRVTESHASSHYTHTHTHTHAQAQAHTDAHMPHVTHK